MFTTKVPGMVCRAALVVSCVALSSIPSACNGGDDGGTPPLSPISPTQPPAGGNTSSLTWTITDGCRDGRGLQIKFFDRVNSLMWPSASEVYVVPSGETRQRTLQCRTSAQVCYGARTDPEGSTYWGVDLTGSRGCETCCTSCRDATITKELSCDGR